MSQYFYVLSWKSRPSFSGLKSNMAAMAMVHSEGLKNI